MEAVEFITQNINPRKVLEYYRFRDMVETTDGIRSCCEIHKGNNPSAFFWNKTNNLWRCYTSDCYGGDIFTLIEKMDNVGFVDAVKKAAIILDLDITDMTFTKNTDVVRKNTLNWINLMLKKQFASEEEIIPYELPYTKYTESNENFKRFDEELLYYYDSKFCSLYPLEESMLRNKLVVPIYFNHVLRGVALRDTIGKYQPKWIYQPKGLKIRDILYNYDNAMQTISALHLTEIIIVEGIFDVWAYHKIGIDNVVAVMGSFIKPEQMAILLKTGLELVLSFDNDEAGNKCTRDTIEKYKYKADIKVITLPQEHDPDDCKEDELKQCYIERK